MDVMEFISLGLALAAVGVILFAYMRPRRRVKAESEKRVGQARRRRFVEVAQEKRLGLPRRNCDCPPDGMGIIVTDEVVPPAEAAAYLTGAKQRDVSETRDYRGVERRKRSRRTTTHHRDAASWHLNAVNRRQTPGRRWADHLV